MPAASWRVQGRARHVEDFALGPAGIALLGDPRSSEYGWTRLARQARQDTIDIAGWLAVRRGERVARAFMRTGLDDDAWHALAYRETKAGSGANADQR